MSVLIASARSQGSDEPVHPHRPAGVFFAHIHKAWVLMKTQKKLRPVALLEASAWVFKGDFCP